MDADTLVRAIRAALDETERIALAADGSRWYLDLDEGGVVEHFEHNDPAAVLRRVAADRRVLERHKPCDDCGPGWSHRSECHRCAQPWPCDEIRDLCDRLGINPETETT